MSAFDDLLSSLEHRIGLLEGLDDESRELAFAVLDDVDTLHRAAIRRLGELLGDRLHELSHTDPAVAWLFEAYGVGVDERAAAEAALETVRPYIESHGGAVEVVSAVEGVVTLRMSGTCSGCTASAVTLRSTIDVALRDHLPGFARTEVEDDGAAPHPPPVGPVPVELRRRAV